MCCEHAWEPKVRARPAQIDPWTGYRRYAPTQRADAADIRSLRDVGFGVAAIGALLAVRGTVPTYSDEGMLWQSMMPALAAQGIVPVGPGGVIEHDDQYMDHDPDLSIFLPVAGVTEASEDLEILDLPARDCLVARVTGAYDQISEAHDLINERLASEGLEAREDGTLAGHSFNIYLTTPDQVSEEGQLTDVCLPLA